MSKRLAFVVWFIVGAVMLAAVLVAPSARADGFSGCEHRSVSHQLEHGGLKDIDTALSILRAYRNGSLS
ncbi:hypothetical protein SEA_MCSHANE_93 [Mycobacterium phage Mcshane]|uniref:RDF protein n=2 Tax=Pegunavirus Pg1 TaxID=1986538 RepID=A0A8F3E1R4_9CAUD|nr:hypothetical protein SEA_MCSHANE_93 [Mycobacterium phage Mcshane]QJD54180.1 hypothetical protein SEA_SLATT_93 [Mycobacterium phage Slatt]QNO12304.1 membrane protein [Mycobacterium phage DirtJuice]QWY79812.1 hypothetical protein SEA_BURR_93 [Mycobacterium phage Burr]QWY81812.1 hypothetical protein SEA_TRUE_92 [Mycobacterium phage True]UTN92244.1 membrane protein [Mycobacterium phage Charles1]WNO26875.1 hypothetical protein SEA_SCRICK_92 [Mycobacterium phage Scrick]